MFPGGQEHAAPMPKVRQRPSDEEIDELFSSVPTQPKYLGALLTGNWVPASWRGPAVPADWAHAVALAQNVVAAVGLKLERRNAQRAPWHPGRCAELLAGGEVIGYAGELHPNVVKAYELPPRACALEINLDALIAVAPDGGEVSALSAFPMTKEDVALVVDEDVPVVKVQEVLTEGAGEWLESIRLFDVFRGEQLGENKKSLAFALGFRHPERTLKESEAVEALNRAVKLAADKLGAVQRA